MPKLYMRLYSFTTLLSVATAETANWKPVGFTKKSFFIRLRKVNPEKILVVAPTMKQALFVMPGESLSLTYKKARKIKRELDYI